MPAVHCHKLGKLRPWRFHISLLSTFPARILPCWTPCWLPCGHHVITQWSRQALLRDFSEHSLVLFIGKLTNQHQPKSSPTPTTRFSNTGVPLPAAMTGSREAGLSFSCSQYRSQEEGGGRPALLRETKAEQTSTAQRYRGPRDTRAGAELSNEPALHPGRALPLMRTVVAPGERGPSQRLLLKIQREAP